MVRHDHSDDRAKLQEYFGWDAPVLYYPSTSQRCAICHERNMPTVLVYPDVANPGEHAVCVSCLSDHAEWDLFGEIILENCEVSMTEVDPGYVASVSFRMPENWGFVHSPSYRPWNELRVQYDSKSGERPASRSPFETKTIPSVDIDTDSAVVVINGVELEYSGYIPVDEEAMERSAEERLREPHDV